MLFSELYRIQSTRAMTHNSSDLWDRHTEITQQAHTRESVNIFHRTIETSKTIED